MTKKTETKKAAAKSEKKAPAAAPAKAPEPKQQPPKAPAAEPKAPKKAAPDRHGESTAEKPVALVHSICERMTKANRDVARKDIIAEAMKKGVAYYTAATQVQRWRAAQKKAK